jgi:general secretion pathway protein E
VRIAVADPSDARCAKACHFVLGARMEGVVATGAEIEALLASDDTAAEPDEVADQDDAERLRDLARAEPAIRQCASLVQQAVESRASDIHIEPAERAYKVRFRVDGILVDRTRLDSKLGLAVVSRLKILSNLDIAERRRPQDGRFTHKVGAHSFDLRVSATPTVHGEGVALRLLAREALAPDLSSLGFSDEDTRALHQLSDKPNGIILLTGPTGSGKTTTLYALIRRLAARSIKILTIEDPVEYRIEGVSQTQTNPAIGLTFASGLRSFLRHDPDVIMVGEMRDAETARTAIQAALTGHLVLSTLHTNDAPSAIMRLLDMGVEDYLVASTLIGAVGQRLVRKLCANCRGSGEGESGPCSHCAGTGFWGRIAICEVLTINEALRNAIKEAPTSGSLAGIARSNGFRTMRDDGEAKVRAGLTTEGELLRAISV